MLSANQSLRTAAGSYLSAGTGTRIANQQRDGAGPLPFAALEALLEGMLTGLRLRIERSLHQMEEQHRRLREIADQLDGAVASGSPADIERWLRRFLDALRSHFDLEENVVFPALHGLITSARPDLARLVREHGRFLESMVSILESAGPVGDAQTLIDALGALRARLVSHERKEESLVERGLDVASR